MEVAPLAVYPLREEYMDFIHAFHVEYSAFLYKPPNTDTRGLDLFFNPLKWQVWIGVIISVPVMAVCIYLFSISTPAYKSQKQRIAEYGMLYKSVWFTFGAFINQGKLHHSTK